MPFAQWHYPFENKELIDSGKGFPADFIAEGVDQTRGWFYTLHAIATMVKDSVAYRNVISNGLVLDKNGQKMSKRLGNAVDPFETIDRYGSDAVRWYLISNAQPWDNLKFDPEGIEEVRRKFFGTLYNTYSFFALYANLDGFTYQEADMEYSQRPEIDRWILSELNTLVKQVQDALDDYEPTRAARLIQYFTGGKPLELVRTALPPALLEVGGRSGQTLRLPDLVHVSGNPFGAHEPDRTVLCRPPVPRSQCGNRPRRQPVGAPGRFSAVRRFEGGQGLGRADGVGAEDLLDGAFAAQTCPDPGTSAAFAHHDPVPFGRFCSANPCGRGG